MNSTQNLGLYTAVYCDESFIDFPLAGLTLINTGEIWSVEYGQLIKSYNPIETIPNIKVLMHSILGAYVVHALIQKKI